MSFATKYSGIAKCCISQQKLVFPHCTCCTGQKNLLFFVRKKKSKIPICSFRRPKKNIVWHGLMYVRKKYHPKLRVLEWAATRVNIFNDTFSCTTILNKNFGKSSTGDGEFIFAIFAFQICIPSVKMAECELASSASYHFVIMVQLFVI